MIVLVALLLLLRKSSSCASPVLPRSLLEVNVFDVIQGDTSVTQNACTGRSTLNILWSCLATTFACTWVSVHPNIPFFGKNKWAVRRWRIFLMFLALLAPEIMIMWAMKQLQGALTIKETINKYLQSQGSKSANSDAAKSERKWSMTHAHYLQMGGFRLRFKDSEMKGDKREAWQTQTEVKVFQHSFGCADKNEGYLDLSLTLDSFKRALNSGIINFPDISEEEIEDKNGRDALSKAIAMFQLLWFVLQIAARSRQNLAITELELTTAALAILNIGMYIAWWKKPTDISCPTILRSRILDATCSDREIWHFGKNVDVNVMTYYWLKSASAMKHAIDAISSFFKVTLKTVVHFIYEAIRSLPGLFANVVENFRIRREPGAGNNSRWFDWSQRRPGANQPKGWINLFVAVFLAIFGFLTVTVKWISWVFLHIFQVLIYYPILAILANGTASNNYSENSEFLISDKTVEVTVIHYKDVASLSETSTIRLLLNKDSNKIRLSMAMVFLTEAEESAPFFCVSAFSGMLFGMIHGLAWNFDSPSQVERILWRVSSLGVVGLCFFMLVGGIIYILAQSSPQHIAEHPRVVFFVRVLSSFFYISSRLSLLILSFLSLRSLPESALDTVQWSLFIPHI